MTAISREVINRIKTLRDDASVCIVCTAYVGLPGGAHHFCPQSATLRIDRAGSFIQSIRVVQGSIEAEVSSVGASFTESMVSLQINRPRGYPVQLCVDLEAEKRSDQVNTFAVERLQAEQSKSWHPMWYLLHLLN